MSVFKGKRWIVPLVLLVAIAAASYLRWEVVGERAVGDKVIKWEKDRWTNEVWIAHYTLYGMLVEGSRKPANDSDEIEDSTRAAWMEEKKLAGARDILAGIMILWLYAEFLWTGKKENIIENTYFIVGAAGIAMSAYLNFLDCCRLGDAV